MTTPLLHIADLHVHYGQIHALKGVSLDVYPGEIVTLIGANGAGKTTLLRTISGILRATSGEIALHLDDRKHAIHRYPPHTIVACGVVQAPEGRMIFHNMSVRENLELGAFTRKRGENLSTDFDFVFSLFPRLKERLTQMGGTLSGGEQQMLAIARALMARPKLLLLDEPSLGIAPTLVQQIFAQLAVINQHGATILLVEQDANLALKTAHRGYVLETGEIVLSDATAQLRENPAVQKAYLGL